MESSDAGGGMRTVQEVEAGLAVLAMVRGKGKEAGSSGWATDPAPAGKKSSEKRSKEDSSKKPAEVQGMFCAVKKHTGMGCAVVTMEDPVIRDLAMKKAFSDGAPVEIYNMVVQLRNH